MRGSWISPTQEYLFDFLKKNNNKNKTTKNTLIKDIFCSTRSHQQMVVELYKTDVASGRVISLNSCGII